MALSSATSPAAVYISRENFPNGSKVVLNCSSFAPRKIAYRVVIRRSSSDGLTETSSATEVKEDELGEEEEEMSLQVPDGPSLINALNVERALRGIPITDKDYYGILGVVRESSVEEITGAYKNKVEELLNQGLDEEEIRDKMDLLKESYTILSSPDEKRMFDWSIARSDDPDRYAWPFEVDKIQPESDTPPEIQDPEDEGAIRLVGYFFLGWFLLSVVLSVTLNR